jgi:hypothetical protein
MSTPKIAASEIRKRLDARDIAIKHSQALELVAAGIGTDRHNLAQMRNLPEMSRVNLKLLTSVASVIARHDLDRRSAIIETTTAVLMQQPDSDALASAQVVHFVHGGIDVVITAAELADPGAFLQTEKARPIIDELLKDQYFSRWESNSSGLSEKTCNAIASDAIELLRSATTPAERKFAAESAMCAHLRPNTIENWWWHEGRSAWDSIADALADAVEEAGVEGYDAEDWSWAIEDLASQRLNDADDSTPDVALSSFDRVEMMFWLIAPGTSVDDLCHIAGPWPEAARVQLNDQFQFALSKLGHTITDWRRHVGSKEASHLTGLRRSRKDAISLVGGEQRPLVSLDDLVTIVDNGCTQYFGLVLYAWVPLADVLELDMSQPVRLTNPRVALYNPYAGTFMEAGQTSGAVVVQDGRDGEFNALVGYSPRDICGLVMTGFEGNLENEEWAAARDASTAAFKDHVSRIGLRQAYPGLKIHWQRKADKPSSLVADVYFGSATGRMERQVVEADLSSGDVPAIIIHPAAAQA